MDGAMLTTMAPVTTTAASAAPVENWFVVVMGLVTVFVCLILLIGLCKLMGILVKSFAKKETAAPAAPAATAPAQDVLPQQLIAAISAAIAEDMNTTPAGLRILSIKKK